MGLASDNHVLSTWVLVIAYMAVILTLVIRGALRTKSISDYAVGNLGFSPYAVGLALAASMTSAATFIINPGFIALYGISGFISFGLVMPIAIFGSLIILTKGFKKYGSSVKALTMAQWMGKMYESRSYRIFFAILSLLLITFIVLICVGLTQVLSKSLNLEPAYVLLAVVAFVFGYMMFGGANSMVYTNAIQAGIMLLVAFILLGSGVEYFENGISGFLAKLNAIDSNLTQTTNPESFLFRDYFEIIFCQVVIGIAIVCQPHIITKSLLLKEDKEVNKYLTIGIIALVVFFFVVFTGLYVRLYFPDLSVNGQQIPMDGLISAYVVSKFPVYLGIVVVLGLISAGLSTLEGLIQSLSATITTDLILPVFGRSSALKSDHNQIRINRLVILLLAIASYWLSYNQLVNPNLSVAIFAQNGVYAYFSAAFVPVLFGTFFSNVSLKTVFASSGVAILVHFTVYYGQITSYMKEPVNNPAIAATFAIIFSLITGVVLHLIFSKSFNRQTLAQNA